MPTVHDLLKRRDLLPILAKRWGIKTERKTEEQLLSGLQKAMTDRATAEKVYDTLTTEQRGALQVIVSSAGNQQLQSIFTMMFGPIRDLGAGAIEREKPHENPISVAEGLFYSGLIGTAVTPDKSGSLTPVVYVPTDTAAVLPLHKTSYSRDALAAEGDHDEVYDLFEDDEDEDVPPSAAAAPEQVAPPPVTNAPAAPRRAPKPESMPTAPPSTSEPPGRIPAVGGVEHPRMADTSLVDDFTTLLAFLQVSDVVGVIQVDLGVVLDDAARESLQPFLLNDDPLRLDFMLLLGAAAQMITLEHSRAYCNRAEARKWLESSRAAQLQALADTWRASPEIVDLALVPGLFPEPEGWSYDPAQARDAILSLIRDHVPVESPWSFDKFIMRVYNEAPAFQRPGGDFTSWYIRDASGTYLSGLENWSEVEGALIEFILTGPLHWLGLANVSDTTAQFNAYGRAFIQQQPFPTRPDPQDPARLEPDGTLRVPRAVSRFDRFQIARFTRWLGAASATEPYSYRLDASGIQRGAAQGIQVEQIASYLQRITGAALPDFVATLLQQWKGGAQASVTLEQVVILRTSSVEVCDRICNAPTLRRYLGARLGTLDVIVRADQWDALRDALGREGIDVDVRL